MPLFVEDWVPIVGVEILAVAFSSQMIVNSPIIFGLQQSVLAFVDLHKSAISEKDDNVRSSNYYRPVCCCSCCCLSTSCLCSCVARFNCCPTLANWAWCCKEKSSFLPAPFTYNSKWSCDLWYVFGLCFYYSTLLLENSITEKHPL